MCIWTYSNSSLPKFEDIWINPHGAGYVPLLLPLPHYISAANGDIFCISYMCIWAYSKRPFHEFEEIWMSSHGAGHVPLLLPHFSTYHLMLNGNILGCSNSFSSPILYS